MKDIPVLKLAQKSSPFLKNLKWICLFFLHLRGDVHRENFETVETPFLLVCFMSDGRLWIGVPFVVRGSGWLNAGLLVDEWKA